MTTKRIILNGTEWITESGEFGYEDVEDLMKTGRKPRPLNLPPMTVTYVWRGPGVTRSGTVYPGGPQIKIEDGMIFNAVEI